MGEWMERIIPDCATDQEMYMSTASLDDTESGYQSTGVDSQHYLTG